MKPYKITKILFQINCFHKLIIQFNFNFFKGTKEKERVNAMKKMKSIERHRYENSHYADDDDNSKFISLDL